MGNYVLNIINMILAFQKKVLTWYYDLKYGKNIKKSSKTFVTAGETLYLNAKEKLDAQEVIEKAKVVFKQNLDDSEGIFEYIKSQGTPVFKIKNARTLLWFVGEDEGFIPPKSFFEALFLCLVINLFSKDKISFSLSTNGMFVLKDSKISPYLLAYYLYHWMAYSKNLSGYDKKTLKQFKKIFVLEHDILARKKLSVEEIISLREAIAREISAIDMVAQLAREISGAKNASKKLQKDGEISI